MRIISKDIRGKARFYVQLVCEGRPYQKNKPFEGRIGLDIGISTVAEVGDKEAYLHEFCQELNDIHSHIRIINRKLDRQRRANNPQNYNPNGTVKRGRKKWNYSNSYIKTRSKLNERNRCQLAYRKSLHGKLINDILSRGNIIYLEKVSYRAWQKVYGRTINNRAPSMFVSELKRKAETGNGKIVEFLTNSTALSQTCQCGRKKKKLLSNRWHICKCGVKAQRDLYSAYLARHVKTNGKDFWLDYHKAEEEWPAQKHILDIAVSKTKELYSENIPSSFGI